MKVLVKDRTNNKLDMTVNNVEHIEIKEGTLIIKRFLYNNQDLFEYKLSLKFWDFEVIA